MPSPLISVILPVYNAELYIAEALESILSQTYENFELILIDDGSIDGSLKIMQSYKDSRIEIISRENRGLIASLNEGMKKAKGKYIARMDADDISLPQRFEKQVNFMEHSPEIGICGTAIYMFGKEIEQKLWKLSTQNYQIKAQLLFSSSLAHPSVMMRKSLITEYVLYYDKQFVHAEDYELWTRFSSITNMSNLEEPLLKYRIISDSASREADKDVKQRYKVISKITDKYIERLGISLTEKERWLHFNLSITERMYESQISFKELSCYFDKLINANEGTNIFNRRALKKVMGKKWLWNLYIRRNFSAIFSCYTLYGIWGELTK